MTHTEVNETLRPILRDFIADLNLIEQRLNDQMVYYRDNHLNWLNNNDFRPGTFSRILSTIIASKFTATKIFEYINSDNWQADYRENHIPEPWVGSNYFGHFRDIILQIRFFIIQSTYSQVETTNRIIIREKDLPTNTKPSYAVNQLTNTYDENFTKFIDFIRNSIHNNGYHFPINANNNYWTYNFSGKNYVFEIGEPINLDFSDTTGIINNILSELINTLRHCEVVNIEIIADIA